MIMQMYKEWTISIFYALMLHSKKKKIQVFAVNHYGAHGQPWPQG
jgi:hypothetical protein